jgi:hypothetical protein
VIFSNYFSNFPLIFSYIYERLIIYRSHPCSDFVVYDLGCGFYKQINKRIQIKITQQHLYYVHPNNISIYNTLCVYKMLEI